MRGGPRKGPEERDRTMGDNVMEAIRHEAGGKGPEAEDQRKGPVQGTDESVLFDEVEETNDKAPKLRLLFKGSSLDDVLAVMGAKAVQGEKQISFKVEALGNREVNEVMRKLFEKARESGTTLTDILALIRAKAAGVDVKGTLKALAEQVTRKQ